MQLQRFQGFHKLFGVHLFALLSGHLLGFRQTIALLQIARGAQGLTVVQVSCTAATERRDVVAVPALLQLDAARTATTRRVQKQDDPLLSIKKSFPVLVSHYL